MSRPTVQTDSKRFFSNPCTRWILSHPGQFSLRVITSFRRNQGLLLSGAVAYYTLLSIIPLFTLLLIGLSHIVDEDQLLATLGNHLDLILASHSDAVLTQIKTFLHHRDVVGWIGLIVVGFFSSMAFSMLENAMSVIFYHRVEIHRRHFLVSAILPYLYILLLGLGLLLMTLVSAALQTIEPKHLSLLGWTLSLDGLNATLLYLHGLGGLIIMLSAIYMVMPLGRMAWDHALIGGTVAGILWELSRHVLVWYFSTLSLVSVVYGSLATTIVVLLSLEVAGMILLLGAQVIAEFEQVNLEKTCNAKPPTEPFHT